MNDLQLKKEQKLKNLFNKWLRNSQRLRSKKQMQKQELCEKITTARVKRQILDQKLIEMAKNKQQNLLNARKQIREREILLAYTLKMNKKKQREMKIKQEIDRYNRFYFFPFLHDKSF